MFAQRTRTLKLSLFAILSAFVVELVFGIFSNSLALITDSVHALLDSIVTVVLLLAARFAIKPPDAEHTYGHGKIESLGGLIGGIAIFLIACFFIVEAIIRIQSPPPSVFPTTLVLIAALYTICTDIFRIVLLNRSIKKVGGVTLKADLYHAAMDFGSTLVVVAGIVLVSFGFHDGDFVAALFLGMLLVFLSLKLIHRTALDLTDIISPDLVSKVRGITLATQGVLDASSVLMRRSGDMFFVDITMSLRGNVSFERAHEISDAVEKNIKKEITNSEITIHFEPSWKDVPKDSKIYEIASDVPGVMGVHNVSYYTSDQMHYVSLHVMVSREMNLEQAHKISEEIEQKIFATIPDINHVTIHLEPHIAIPTTLKSDYKKTDQKILEILKEYGEIKKIGNIVTLYFDDLLKIDIDCSFDKDLTIESVHDLTSQIEQKIRGQFKNSVITIHPEPF
ncbi:cation diffusion facilitator family transporter [Candidatus Nitrosotenuis chungbukensis]|uniref:cation diffusion facilitator family transporter n=1 Tax=Candidatus Nitrosotenuis chungbukensis TaxID=1353246 RepID=UPI0005B29023|nr:cation diffusion facilitator family transporter [Candidatus Nitrosotenuis chungbukensis]